MGILDQIQKQQIARAPDQGFAERITAAWRSSFEGILETGRLLIEAKEKLPHGAFEKMIESELPFKPSTAQRLMKISGDERLANPAHVQLLPPHWGTLYELTKLPDAVFEAKVADGSIHPEMQRIDVMREVRRAELAGVSSRPVVLPEGRFGTIVIDPPWPMEKIEREVTPNQVAFDYPTMNEDALLAYGDTVEGCAADDCHLFMWTTHKFLPMALRLLDAWGFRYVLTMVWHKPGGFQPFGLPQYNCEFAVYARRGSPAFVDTKAFNACFEGARREHSRKPDEFYDLIRRVTGEGRIDIFSREPRDGFAQIGNEADKFEEVA